MKKLLMSVIVISLCVNSICYGTTFTQELRATSGDYGAVTVTSSATLIVSQQNTRSNIIIVNNGSTTLYIGWDTSVTATNGLPVLPNASITITDCNLPIYGISTADLNIRYLKEAD